MANKTVTVKSALGDYSSLNSALAGESADLVTNTCILTIECYSMQDTTQADTGTGYTTSTDYYINITVPVTERHSGVWNTNKYYLDSTTYTGDPGCLRIQEDHVKVTGVQMTKSHTGDWGFTTCINGTTLTGLGIYFDSCILKPASSACADYGIYRQSGKFTIINSLIYGFAIDGIQTTWGGYNEYAHIQNCVITKNGGYGVNIVSGNYTLVKNCYLGGNTSGAITGTVTETTNNKTTALADAGFTDIGAGTENFHIGLGSILIGAGTDLSASFTNDIDGETRPTGAGTWDIGADQYSVGIGGPAYLKTWHGIVRAIIKTWDGVDFTKVKTFIQ